MQVLFGEELLGRSWWQKTKGAAKKTGRVTGRVATSGLRQTAKAVKVVRPLAPAIALVPGVGTAAAAGIVAANQGINLTRSAKKSARSVLPANITSRPFAKSITPKKKGGIPANLTSRAFAKTVTPVKKTVVKPLAKFSMPDIDDLKKVVTSFPGAVPPPAAPEKSAFEKNLPLIGAGAVALLLLMKKR